MIQKTWREEPIADEVVRKWLLGSGLAMKIYYDEMDPTRAPLDIASPLIMMNGVLSGTFAPTGCRSSWRGRSLLTGIWNEANLAYYWGGELRAAGYDLERLRRATPGPGLPRPMPLHASDAATVKLCYDYQSYARVYNPLGLCKFLIKGQVGSERLCAVVNAALGWDWTTEDVLDAGDRIFQLKQLINLRLGITAADDRLPDRFTAEPRPTGGAAGILPDMAVMLPIYYEMRGWDEKGAPAPERPARLGIS